MTQLIELLSGLSGNEHKAWQAAYWSHVVVEVAVVAAIILVVNARVQTLRKDTSCFYRL